VAVILPVGNAFSQQAGSSPQEELIGTWVLVSSYNQRPDGSKVVPFPGTPTGILMRDGNGRVSAQQISTGLPKFASNNRQEGTPEENKAVVQGNLCYFGTYSVNETDRTFTVHVENCTFPNWAGTDQKRSFTLVGDGLTLTGSAAASGGTAHVVWKRAK
jgi:Lipocalin-like domain